MSINVLKVREPRLDIEPDRTYVAMMGGSHVTTKSYTADTASNSQIIYSITTPSVRVGMDRRVDLEASFDISCLQANDTAATLNANFADILNAGPRQFPLHSIVEVVNARLNDQAFSYEPSQSIHALLSYGNSAEDRQHFMGSSPHKPDIYWNYNIGGGNAGTRNPYSGYFNSGYEDSRSLRFWATDVGANTLRLTIYESLMLSPFYWGRTDYQCLFGIQHFDLTLTLTNIRRILAGAADGIVGANGIWTNGDITKLNVQVRDSPNQKIHLTFITPQPDQEIPRLLHYPFYQIKRYSQNGGTIAPAGAFPVSLDNITLHEIPKRMYIFAKPAPSNDPTVADFYAGIDRLTLNFDNQDGRLSTLDNFDLWKICAKNGLMRSYLDFSKIMGAVLCFEFGTDLNLNPLLCAGVRGNFQFSADVQFRDLRAAGAGNVTYRIYTITVPEGVLTVDDQLISISIGTLTEEIVATAPFAPSGHRVQIQNYYGSGFFSNIWSGIKKAFKVAKPVLRDVAGAVGAVAPLIPHPYAQGVGLGANVVKKALGGRKMRSSSLARRL